MYSAMFCELVSLFFALIDIIISAPSPHSFIDSNVQPTNMQSFISTSHLPTRVPQNELFLQQLSERTTTSSNIATQRKGRGIVLVDEDFNVPPEPGTKQSWSDGDFDKNTTKPGTKDFELTSMEERSEPSSSTGEFASAMTSRKVTPEKLLLSTEVSSTTEYQEIEGSGDITVQYTSFPTVTEDSKETDDTTIIKTCLNLTCDAQDLIISPGVTRMVPEGTNLTVSCATVNASEQVMLKLYKCNDSNNLLLQESSKEQKLNFDIPGSRQHHSGTYMCLKFTKQSCCYKQLDITIYEVPNYTYHLIIVGLVAAVSLFTCILLGINKRMKAKRYEEQLELQNMEKAIVF